MSDALYKVLTGGQVASAAAATAKSILGVKAHANSGLILKQAHVDLDGVTASEKPVLIELCQATFATNSPGTNSTSVTPVQQCGRVMTAGFTAGKTWTAEPTVLTVLGEFSYDPNKGYWLYDYSLGDEPDCALAEGWVIRTTVPSGGAAVNYRAEMLVRRN